MLYDENKICVRKFKKHNKARKTKKSVVMLGMGNNIDISKKKYLVIGKKPNYLQINH